MCGIVRISSTMKRSWTATSLVLGRWFCNMLFVIVGSMVEDADWSFPYVWDGTEVLEEPLYPAPVKSLPVGFQRDIEEYYEQMKLPL